MAVPEAFSREDPPPFCCFSLLFAGLCFLLCYRFSAFMFTDLTAKRVLRSVKSWQVSKDSTLTLYALCSLLHLLSPQTVQQITDQLVECVGKSQSPTALQGLVDCVVEMAQAEKDCALLGRLCSELSSELPPALDEPTGEAITFRRLLVNKLQMEYESTISEREDAVMTGDEQRLRPQLLRNVRLLAELFRQRMLTERICHEIIQELLKPAHPPDMYIEAVCEFCNSIGKLLERSGKSRRIFDAYFNRLKDLARHPQRTQELKVMIHKLIQIRANNWEELENVFEHLDEVANALKISQQEARTHHLARMAAELDASSARQEARALESKYNKELKRRKETEDALAKEMEKLKKTRRGRNICKKELKKTRREREIFRKERDDLQIELDDALEMIEIYEKERDDLQIERDNALEITEDLLRHKREETSLQSYIHSEELQTLSSFICPISQEVMKDPHVAADGFTYEAEAIRQWLDSGHDLSPMTNLKLCHRNLVPNHALRSAIQEWLQHQR